MESMDLHTVEILCEWHAYYIANSQVKWPWKKWTYVINSDTNRKKRRYCLLVIEKLTRLLSHDRVKKLINKRAPQMIPLIPLNCEPHNLTLESVKIDNMSPEENKILLLKAKSLTERISIRQTDAQLLNYVEENLITSSRGNNEQALLALFLAISQTGIKSISFLNSRIERYRKILIFLLKKSKRRAVNLVLDALLSFWAGCGQRFLPMLERLQSLHIVFPTEIISWCLQHVSQLNAEEESFNLTVMHVIHQCISISMSFKSRSKWRLSTYFRDMEIVEIHIEKGEIKSMRKKNEKAGFDESITINRVEYIKVFFEKKNKDCEKIED
jgi:hypothetical protein